MKLLKQIVKSIWYMAKAGLRYGALLGGLFGVAIGLVSSIGSPYIRNLGDVTNYCFLTGLVGTVMGGALGPIIGAIDSLVLLLLVRIWLSNQQRRRIQALNALVAGGIGFLLFMQIFSSVSAPLLFPIIAFIVGGGFWRATREYLDEIMWATPL